MSVDSAIQWTDNTWNPVVGCTIKSPGCFLCYAGVLSHRLEKMGKQKYVGLTVKRKAPDDCGGRVRAVFNGTVRAVPSDLHLPLHWKRPRRVFVNSMSDLFHEHLDFEYIAACFGVMQHCPQHSFQVLTKRPEIAAKWYRWLATLCESYKTHPMGALTHFAQKFCKDPELTKNIDAIWRRPWPLENVWVGASTENQDTLDERIDHLRSIPAVVRFLSCEPLLSPLSFRPRCDSVPEMIMSMSRGDSCRPALLDGIDWVIVGAESRGQVAGRFAEKYPEAARGIISQCNQAGVPVFHKQMPILRKGLTTSTYYVSGEMPEWPEDLQVRQMPKPRKQVA